MTQRDDPEMERRLLVAIVLSMGILFLAPYVLRSWYPAPDEQSSGSVPAAGDVPTTPIKEERPLGNPLIEVREPLSVESGSSSEAIEGGSEFVEPGPETIRVQTDVLDLTFSNRGGVLQSAQTIRFRDNAGNPVECLPQELSVGVFPAFGLEHAEEGAAWNEAFFAVERREVDHSGTRCQVVRFFRPFTRATIEKRFEVCDGSFFIHFALQAQGLAENSIRVALPGALGRDPVATEVQFPYLHGVAFLNGSLQKVAPGDVEEGVEYTLAGTQWVGIDSQYFSVVLLPNDPAAVCFRRVVFQGEGGADDGGVESVQVVVSNFRTGRVFIGPKEEGILKGIDPSLVKLIDYGWFGFLVRPLLICLRWLYEHVGNYGWAIIILTFLINVLLVPLRYKQIVSMRKISELQPKMRSIQDRYKKMKRDDPRRQQMNAEIMNLYREHGVNPLGGCLPLLIQMPILFAFYQMLVASIELRGAPFILWIRDLSKPDPYYVTPIVMGVTMVWQQKITPTGSTDPAQQKIMMLLPVFFTFLFLNVSSGLAVYFLFSNLFGIAFQVALEKLRPDLAPAKGGRRAKD